MTPTEIAARLAANAEVFRHLLADVSPEQARWKPAPEKWSLLEVINHLADEERDDFRTRLQRTLHHPEQGWPPIDPERWAVDRQYNSRDLAVSLADFLEERTRSLAWLRGLSKPDFASAHHHKLGTITAGDLLSSWLAHDFIHIRQMTRLHYEYLASARGASTLRYAGPW